MENTVIGNTPLIKINKLNLNGNQVFAKCEYQNPTGSHKDRTFIHIINELEKTKKIRKGMTLIECSTGNGGASLAWIAQRKGYKTVIFMPEGMTQERKDQILRFGATIVETAKDKFLSGTIDSANSFLKKNRENTFFIDQSTSLLNKEAWYQCGHEICEQLNRQRIIPDYFICSIGTGGTFSGISHILKSDFPRLKTIAIEVENSSPIYALKNHLNFKHRNHNLMGLGAGIISVNTDIGLIDEVVTVNGNQSWKKMKEYNESEKMNIGPTCGANLVICEKLVEKVENKTIITLFFDSAWKYKSRWDGIYPEYSE
ncbi:cysteine synthase family protein [Yersinia ruckeri]|uniref:cysteine synthase family protein n=1 Tax=Yersinia ruckeri TaxID=29486 RepID=UPI0011A5BB03|nr:cysteine synthase family protein [Yersinia ruckeri]EKN3345842.1 cysteine synthase family protein [Yersinia ruckeri]EKN3361568.1 cysteine synthase family protein [Yersinia ruckeri]EKN4201092.1 cysteine synthase family protein [Yersinia ruckeri]EKN4207317.1 cysteine synthase family protein [Yersinia ruckeri]EKN4697845.1 cysteine synthase family protein [Yersinia ruckeri]